MGYYRELNQQQLIDEIKYLMTHVDIRDEIAERAKSLVDGNGCRRIVEKVEQRVFQDE